MNKLIDVNDPKLKFEIMESADVDGEYVLAKVKGVFFVPDGKSRNGRYYPKSLWEKVISSDDVKYKLKSKGMFGTVGHEQDINDRAIREGSISHIVTKLTIDESNKGIGEALILNTPVGRNLNTILRAGGNMFVSTRANGTFKGKHKGMPVVDEDTYSFETVDFVIDPGFLEANPKLAESMEIELEKTLETKENNMQTKDGDNMSEKLIEHISNENHELKNKVSDLTDEVTTLKENHISVKEENDHMKGEVEKCEGDKKIIETYTVLGTVEEITEKLEKGLGLEKFLELGENFDEVKAALEKSIEFSSDITEKFGTVEEIEKALTEAISFRESISEMGTVEEIKTVLEETLKTKEAANKIKTDETNKALAEELGLEVEKVEELLTKYSVEDIKELHSAVSTEVKVEEKNTYVKENFNEDNTEIKPELSESRILGKSRADRLSERFARV